MIVMVKGHVWKTNKEHFKNTKWVNGPLYLQSNKRVNLKWNFNYTKVEEHTEGGI